MNDESEALMEHFGNSIKYMESQGALVGRWENHGI